MRGRVRRGRSPVAWRSCGSSSPPMPSRARSTRRPSPQRSAAGSSERAPSADLCPVADGGEGTMELLAEALGARLVTVTASDPLGRPVECRFAIWEGVDPSDAPQRGARRSTPRRRDRRDGAGVGPGPRRRARARRPRGLDARHRRAHPRRGRARARARSSSRSAAARRPTAASGAIEAIRDGGGLRGARLVGPVRRRDAVRGRAADLRPAEGRRRGDGRVARGAPASGSRPSCRATRAACRGPAPRAGCRAGCGRRSTRSCARRRDGPRRARRRRADARGAARRRGGGLPGRAEPRRQDRRRARAPGARRPACRSTRSSGASRLSPEEARAAGVARVWIASTLEEIEAAGEALGRAATAGVARA